MRQHLLGVLRLGSLLAFACFFVGCQTGAIEQGSQSGTGAIAVNPRILESIQIQLCHNDKCIRSGRARYEGLTLSPSSLDDKHPLLRASEDLTDAVGSTVIGMPLPSESAPRAMSPSNHLSLQAALVDLAREAPDLVKPFMDLYEQAIEKAVVPKARSGAVRNCLRTFVRAFRRSMEEDFLLVAQQGCGKEDADGGYENLIESLWLMKEHAQETIDALDENPAFGSELMRFHSRARQYVDKISSLVQEISDAQNRYLESEASLRRLVPVSSLDPIVSALRHGRETWNESIIQRACIGDGSPANPGQLRAINEILNKRFMAVKHVLSKRWQRLVGGGVLANLVGAELAPRFDSAEISGSLSIVTLSARAGRAEKAGFSHEEGVIVITSGLVAELCSDANVNDVQQVLAQDSQNLDELAGRAQGGLLSFKDVYSLLTRMASSDALAYAERRELEFVSALDFVIAHETAHAVFDYRSSVKSLKQRDRELRADGFAFAIVDRTSEISMFKKISELGVRGNKLTTGIDKILEQTLPGGAAMLKIYNNTSFEAADVGHLPLSERMDWITRWMNTTN